MSHWITCIYHNRVYSPIKMLRLRHRNVYRIHKVVALIIAQFFNNSFTHITADNILMRYTHDADTHTHTHILKQA